MLLQILGDTYAVPGAQVQLIFEFSTKHLRNPFDYGSTSRAQKSFRSSLQHNRVVGSHCQCRRRNPQVQYNFLDSIDVHLAVKINRSDKSLHSGSHEFRGNSKAQLRRISVNEAADIFQSTDFRKALVGRNTLQSPIDAA